MCVFSEADDDHFIRGRFAFDESRNDEIEFDVAFELNDLSTDSSSMNFMIEWTFWGLFIALHIGNDIMTF